MSDKLIKVTEAVEIFEVVIARQRDRYRAKAAKASEMIRQKDEEIERLQRKLSQVSQDALHNLSDSDIRVRRVDQVLGKWSLEMDFGAFYKLLYQALHGVIERE